MSVGVEPTRTGLQPAAWPSGSDIETRPAPGLEPGPLVIQASVLSITPHGRSTSGFLA